MSTVLIVDDNPQIFKSLCLNFLDYGIASLWAQNEADTLKTVAEAEIDAVLLDLSLGKENGLDILEKLLSRHPGLPVIMITGFGTLEAAVTAIKLGAYDFLPKPLDFDKLYHIVQQTMELAVERAEGAVGGRARASGRLVTASPVLLAVCDKARLISVTSLPVLIVGESGCGKELMAEMIHLHSPRAAKPLVRVNCSAFPETLIDNELFGHEKGAFTGAEKRHRGLFEQADGGTLLLDEIGDLAPASQAKLLRVLEEKRIRRLGGDEDIPVDVRIIASTNRDLPGMIKDRLFREDLFYRLNSAFLYLPPLRERREDIPLLTGHFLAASGNGVRKRFAPDAAALLAAYDWPGNVRELKNVVELCLAIAPRETIEISDIPAPVNAAPAASAGGTSVFRRASTLDEAERNMIVKTLSETNHNKKRTSECLGISYKTLFNKMKHHGIK